MSSSSLARTSRGRCVIPGWARFIAAQIRASWPATHEPLDLPTITIGPLMTDDDVDFHTAVLDLRNTLDDWKRACIANPFAGFGSGPELVDAERFIKAWTEQYSWGKDWTMDVVAC